jgi:hypothetical protein
MTLGYDWRSVTPDVLLDSKLPSKHDTLWQWHACPGEMLLSYFSKITKIAPKWKVIIAARVGQR